MMRTSILARLLSHLDDGSVGRLWCKTHKGPYREEIRFMIAGDAIIYDNPDVAKAFEDGIDTYKDGGVLLYVAVPNTFYRMRNGTFRAVEEVYLWTVQHGALIPRDAEQCLSAMCVNHRGQRIDPRPFLRCHGAWEVPQPGHYDW